MNFISLLKMDKKLPDIRPGDIVRVYQKIKEGKKEREQAFEGVVIKRQGGKMSGASFVVRKISQGIGVERKFPLYSPTLTKIQIKKRSKVKRADLSYLRNVGQIRKKLKDRKIEPFEESLIATAKDAEEKTANVVTAKESAKDAKKEQASPENKDPQNKKEEVKKTETTKAIEKNTPKTEQSKTEKPTKEKAKEEK